MISVMDLELYIKMKLINKIIIIPLFKEGDFWETENEEMNPNEGDYEFIDLVIKHSEGRGYLIFQER